MLLFYDSKRTMKCEDSFYQKRKRSTHTSTKPDDPPECDLYYDELGEEDHSNDDDDETHDPYSDLGSSPKSGTLNADVHDLLNQSSKKVENTDSMLTHTAFTLTQLNQLHPNQVKFQPMK